MLPAGTGAEFFEADPYVATEGEGTTVEITDETALRGALESIRLTPEADRPPTPTELIAATITDIRAPGRPPGTGLNQLVTDAVAALLFTIAIGHVNTPQAGVTLARGYCTGCGGYIGIYCSDLSAALALAVAWRVSRESE